MDKIEKGCYGYIDYRKRKRLIKAGILFGIALLIFIVGYFLNEKSTSNVFSIITVAIILPAAKVLVSYIVIFPYRTMEKKRFEEVSKHIAESMTFLADLVITSTEKVMNLDCMVIVDKHILCLAGKEKQDYNYIEVYLNRGVNNQGFEYKVELFTDIKEYISALDKLSESAETQELMGENNENNEIDHDLENRESEREELTAYLLSMVV